MNSQPTDIHHATIETILVADDNETYRRFVELQMRAAGWNCLSASSHAEALKDFQQHPEISVILLDYMMYGTPPDAFLKQLRECGRNLRVIGHSSMDHREDFAALGVPEFFAKPLRVEDLCQALRANVADAGNAP